MNKNEKILNAMKRSLIQSHGWIELAGIEGIVEGTHSSSREGTMALSGSQEFAQTINSSFELEQPASITGFFVVVTGPDIIYSTQGFLEKLFQELSIEVSMENQTRSIPVVRGGKVNQKGLSLMGEIRDWIMYMVKDWGKMNIKRTGKIPVTLELRGMTSLSGEKKFALGLFVKAEINEGSPS